MNQPRARCVGCHSEVADGVDVDESALSFFLFGAVNGGVCSAVDYVCDVVVKDEGFHGFGIKSMRMIAEKYNGNVTARQDGELFVLTANLFDPQA